MSKFPLDFKPKQGTHYESKEFGCYDKGMNPYPTWEVPSEFKLEYNGRFTPVRPVYYIGSQNKVIRFTATYHPHPNFRIPESLNIFTPEESSFKLKKNARPSLVLYMSPVKRNSFLINTCAMASIGCEMACLDYSGQKVGQMKQRASIARTDMFFAHTSEFFERLWKEIKAYHCIKMGEGAKEIAVRLNGTSDLPIFDKFMDYCQGIGLKLPPPSELVFYDYTKFPDRVTTSKESEMTKYGYRHKVTYSLSEEKNKIDSMKKASDILIAGGSIAAVFIVPKGQSLPSRFTFEKDGKKYSFPIVDGDESDDLMLDKHNVVLGLKAKQRAKEDKTGFAIPLTALNFNPNSADGAEFIAEYEANKEIIEAACGLKSAPVRDFFCAPDKKPLVKLP